MAPDSHHNVPYVIRSRRIMLGLSQARLAELVGRTATTVRRWERGEVAPPEDVLDQLAAALDVAPEQLQPLPPPARSSVVVGGPASPAPPTRAPRPPTDRAAPTRPGTAPATRPAPPPGPALPPAGDTTTDAPGGEPWIHFDAEPTPPPDPQPAPPPAPGPSAKPVPAASGPAAPVATAPRPAPAAPPADPDATAAVPPPRRPVARQPVAPARSYLEDPKQRLLYGFRLTLAVVALGVMAVIGVWALGELFGALDEVLEFFSETTVVDTGLELPTLPGAES